MHGTQRRSAINSINAAARARFGTSELDQIRDSYAQRAVMLVMPGIGTVGAIEDFSEGRYGLAALNVASDIPWLRLLKAGRIAGRTASITPKSVGRFPAEPDDFSKVLGVEPKITTTQHGSRRYLWEPNSNTRIRFESHPGDAGTFNPRHHGEHYHIEIKPDNLTWNQAKKKGLISKVKPEDYIPGHGTGHLPGEPFPGQ